MSKWIKCITKTGLIRSTIVECKSIVQEIVNQHTLPDRLNPFLGEALVGGLLLGSTTKNGERVNLNVQSEHIGQVFVDAHAEATCRGYISSPVLDPPPLEDGMGPWGEGLMAVLRTKFAENAQPYIGTVPLLTGFMAKDITFYLSQSEQIPSALGIAVHMSGRTVEYAGGFLIQTLGGASEEDVEKVLVHMRGLSAGSLGFENKGDAKSVMSTLFQDTEIQVTEERDIKFECSCSADRVERSLILLGQNELKRMAAMKETAEVRCDFCSTFYQVTTDRIASLITQARE